MVKTKWKIVLALVAALCFGCCLSFAVSQADAVPENGGFRVSGASVRMYENLDNEETINGLRFRIALSESLFEEITAEENVQIGCLIVPAKSLSAPLTLESDEDGDGKIGGMTVYTIALYGKESGAETISLFREETDETGTCYAAYPFIYDYPNAEEAYRLDLACRAYYIVGEGDAVYSENDKGQTDATVRSLEYVAYQALNDENAGYEENTKESLKGYLTDYTVSFDSGAEAQTVTYGNTASFVYAAKPGSALKGWKNGETEYNFDLPVRSDLYLTADFIDGVNVSNLSATQIYYNEGEYGLKLVPEQWIAKFKLNDEGAGIAENYVFNVFSEYEDSAGSRALYYLSGQNNSNKSLLAELEPGKNSMIVLTRTQYENLINGTDCLAFAIKDYAGSVNSNDALYVSEVETVDIPYNTNGLLQLSSDFLYGDETYSYKMNAGTADCRIYIKDAAKEEIPENATNVVFYIYHEYGSAINFQYCSASPWSATDKASLASNTWTKVTLSVEEFKDMDEQGTEYFVRAQLWASCDYYVSGLYFE